MRNNFNAAVIVACLMLLIHKNLNPMATETHTQQKTFDFNKPCYVLFLLTGIVFMITRNFSQATIFWGLALVFDPFDKQTPFPQRPFYQQAWLIVHLSITVALFVLMGIKK
jgi:hypothetical protein